MVSKAYSTAVVLALVFSALIVQVAAGATIGWTEDASVGNVDLTSMLRRAPFHEARVFEVARKHIQEIQSSPACHQLATSTLIDSCQSFSSLPGQDSARPTDHSLDEVRQGYAARLAVCELQGIQSGIPIECASFMPSRQACSRPPTKSFFSLKSASSQEVSKRACYPDFTPQQLKKCVDSLFHHAQRWTSYSNAQTNAMVICQASRGAVENDEHLQKLKEAVEFQATVSETLLRVVRETEGRLAQHDEFARAVQQFQHDLIARNEAALDHAYTTVTRLVGKFDSATEALFGIFTQLFKSTTDEVNVLNDNIQSANADVDKARAALQALHGEAILRESERTAAQELSLRENQELVTNVQTSLENVRDIAILEIVDRLHGIEATVTNYLDIHEQALRDQQVFQEAQTRIMHNQNAIQTTLLTQHELLEEKTQKIRDLAAGGLGGTIATYLGLTLCIILLSWANLVLGAAAAMGVGIVGAFGSTTIAHIISLDGLTLTPFKSAVFRYLAWTLAFSTATMSIVFVILAGSLLARRLFVSHTNISMLLDIEAPKRRLLLDDF